MDELGINRNVRLIARPNRHGIGLDIYLDRSGRKVFLMAHRDYGPLYELLKDGVAVSDIRRVKAADIGRRSLGRRPRTRLYRMVRHIVMVTESWLLEGEAA